MNKAIAILGVGVVTILGLSHLIKSQKPIQGASSGGGGGLVIVTEGAPASPSEKSANYSYNIKVEAPKFEMGATKKGAEVEEEKPKKIGKWRYSKKEGVLVSPEGEGYSTAYPEEMVKQLKTAVDLRKKKQKEPDIRTFFRPEITRSWWWC